MKKSMKYVKPLAVLSFAFATAALLHTVDTRPTEVDPNSGYMLNLKTEPLILQDHIVKLKSWAKVEPWQKTDFGSQVSGQIIEVHPDFEVGGLVRQGTVLVELDPSNYISNLISSKAELAIAESDLFEEEASAEVARRQLQGSSSDFAKPLALREPQVAAAKARVQAAKARLSAAERDLKRTKLAAPYDAIIVSKNVGKGQIVEANQVVARMYDTSRAMLVLPITSFDLNFLDLDNLNESEISITSYSGERVASKARIMGSLGIIDEKTRMQHLLIYIDEPYQSELSGRPGQASVKFGAFVEVEISGKILEDVYEIPQYLVADQLIWVVDNDSRLVSRSLNILRESADKVYVRGEIAIGDELVTTVPDFPVQGTLVNRSNP